MIVWGSRSPKILHDRDIWRLQCLQCLSQKSVPKQQCNNTTMAGQDGRWAPCMGCTGCMIEYAKPKTEEPLECRQYCSKVFWLTADGGFKEPPKAPKKRMPRKLSKKQQLWANYHKQQAEIKKANFFKPRANNKKKQTDKETDDKHNDETMDGKPSALGRPTRKL